MTIWHSDDGDKWYVSVNGTNILASNQSEAIQMASQQDYIEQVKAANKQVWDGINNLVELQKRWNALDYGNTLVDATGALTALEIGAVVFDTANAMVAVQAAGHATNMAKLL